VNRKLNSKAAVNPTMISRRHFITTGACAGSALAVNAAGSAAPAAPQPMNKPIL